jgi:hypothetical protein
MFSVTPSSLDFGNVKIGSSKTDTVTVTNSGTGSLSIYQVASDFSEFKVSPDNGTIDAGKNMKFLVTFEPQSGGPKTANLVFSHTGISSPDTLRLRGTTILPPVFTCSTVSIDFGDVANGTRKTDSILVKNTGWDTLRITNITSANSVFTCSPPGNVNIPPASSLVFYLSFYPLISNKYSSEVKFFSNTSYGVDKVSVKGQGTGPAAAPICVLSTHAIDFGTVQTADTARDSVRITNAGNAPLNISPTQLISSAPQAFTYTQSSTADIPAGGSRTVHFTFRPDSPHNFTAVFKFGNNTANSPDSIMLRGNGVGDSLIPVFQASPVLIAFDSLPTGLVDTAYVTLTNAGLARLSFTSIKLSRGTNFNFGWQGAMYLEPLQTKQVPVYFRPQINVADTSWLKFQHNAGNGLDSVMLTGVGLEMPAPRFVISRRVVNFDTVLTGGSRKDSIIVTNTGVQQLNVAGITSDNPRFAVYPSSFALYRNQTKKLYLYHAPIVNGRDSAHIVFTSNAPEGTDTLLLTGEGVGGSDSPGFTLSKNSLDFGHVAIEDTVPKVDSFAVINNCPYLLKIINVSMTPPTSVFSINMRTSGIAPHDTGWMLMTYDPLSVGETYGWVVFDHNAPTRRDSVMLHGVCDSTLGRAVLGLEPGAMDFRGVLVNTVMKKRLVLHNYGRDTLVVSAMTSPNPAFAFSAASAVVPPMSAKTYEVSFSPVNTIRYDGLLNVTSNAREQNDTLAVSGLGVSLSKIASVRSMPNGSDVAFRGVVTRSKGAYTRMQDSTGAITIRQQSGAFASAIANYTVLKGDTLLILGRTSEMNNLKVIADSNINGFTAISHGNLTVVPLPLTLAEIAANGEQYESRLITVHNITIDETNDPTFKENTTYAIHDTTTGAYSVSLFIPKSEDTRIAGKPFLPKADFTGVLGQSSFIAGEGYQLVAVEVNDLTAALDGVEHEPAAPREYSLSNYPNPFSGVTTIVYAVPSASFISLTVFDRLGRDVAQLASGFVLPGTRQARFYAGRLPDGMYYYRLQAGVETIVGKMVVRR